MTSIKESAQSYQPPKTLVVSDLDKVSINEELHYKVVKEGEPEEFSYDYFLIDDQEYRIPTSVIVQLKEWIVEKPEMEFFKVKKSGDGMKTKYTVIPQ